MTEAQDICRRYQERFGNLEELSFPAIVNNRTWLTLLQQAIGSGVALTPETLQQTFPEARWEEVMD